MTGVEPATLCLASTRSSQLSYTRKSEEVLVASRLWRVNLSNRSRRAHRLGGDEAPSNNRRGSSDAWNVERDQSQPAPSATLPSP